MAQQPSFLLVEEYFSTGDDRFLEALREFHVPGRLATFADKWKKDPRPWARRQIELYLQLPLNAPAHETVVKRLFKNAEEVKDDALMSAFAVAFDRLVRRRRKTHHQYDWRSRTSWTEEWLQLPRNTIPAPNKFDRRSGPITRPQFDSHDLPPLHQRMRLFSHHTRYYLRRRAWRYFRRMGYSKPVGYVAAVSGLLARYRDEDLATGESILDSWCLLHACFGESDVLEFGVSHATLHEGRALRELAPAPSFPALWKLPTAMSDIIELILSAQSRTVRVWAIQLLQRDHADTTSGLAVAYIRRLLDHPDSDVQLLGAQLLEKASGLEKLTVDEWLQLLATRNIAALETITQLMVRYVTPERLSVEQLVKIATANPAPVARLGLSLIKNKGIRGNADLDAIAGLSAAMCAALGTEIAQWAMSQLLPVGAFEVDRVSRFFDALLIEVREGAWSAAMAPGTPAWDDAALWSRLIETPYDDVRLHLVSALQTRAAAPGLKGDQLSALWATVLLGIHRGGRHKLIALRQISDAVRELPESAERLLPVLAVAIRSVRAPEARAGLAAVVGAVEARPELAPLVATHLPELLLSPQEVTA